MQTVGSELKPEDLSNADLFTTLLSSTYTFQLHLLSIVFVLILGPVTFLKHIINKLRPHVPQFITTIHLKKEHHLWEVTGPIWALPT